MKRKAVTTAGLCVAVCLAAGGRVGADTHHVAQLGQTPSGDYTSWETAASNIQDAVDQAVNGDTVLVSNGVYNVGGTASARVDFGARNISLLALGIHPRDTVIDGGGTLSGIYSTSGDGQLIAGFTITNCGQSGIYFVANPASPLVVSNCVIDGNSHSSNGGGVYASNAGKMILSQCVVRNNETAGGGGGVYNGILTNNCQVLNNRNPAGNGGGLLTCTMHGGLIAGNSAKGRAGADRCVLHDVTVSNNIATGDNYYGGGMSDGEAYGCRFFDNSASNGYGGGISQSLASNCLFSGNYAKFGGAAGNKTSSTLLLDCTVSNNRANPVSGNGGGIYNAAATNCVLVTNSAYWGGAAAYCESLTDCIVSNNCASVCAGIVASQSGGTTRTTRVTRCEIVGNAASNYGGGIFGTCLARNCLIAGNRASRPAGAHGATLINCTVVGNRCLNTTYAAGVSGGSLTNCIVWDNRRSSGVVDNYSDDPVFAFSCTTPAPTGGSDGGDNRSADPKFVDAAAGNYRLQGNSPCVNTGSNLDWTELSLDLDSDARLRHGTVDMGAYEYLAHGSVIAIR